MSTASTPDRYKKPYQLGTMQSGNGPRLYNMEKLPAVSQKSLSVFSFSSEAGEPAVLFPLPGYINTQLGNIHILGHQLHQLQITIHCSFLLVQIVLSFDAAYSSTERIWICKRIEKNLLIAYPENANLTIEGTCAMMMPLNKGVHPCGRLISRGMSVFSFCRKEGDHDRNT